MSTKIAVVCEDPRNDRYIVLPVIELALARLGKMRAEVRVIENPRMRGIHDVFAQACDVLDRYGGMSAAVIFVVDTDCEDGQQGRRDRRAQLENAISTCQRYGDRAVVVLASQEVEVWAIWGIRAQLGSTWEEVRSECHPKEMYFKPQITRRDRLTPDGGRRRLIASSLAGGWDSVVAGCPEVGRLLDDLRPLVT